MNSLNRFADPFYCVMRLVVGLMFACHGLDKIFGTFAGKVEPLPPLMVVGGWLEIICGFLVAVGLLTRLPALLAPRRNGRGVFHGARATGFDSLRQQGRACSRLLLCLLLHLSTRCRHLEHRWN